MARFLVKASEFKNVCKAVNDRKLAELKKEIIEILKKQDENEVKKAIDYFNSQELHYTHLEKSLISGKWIQKAGYGVGTVRIWKGKKYKKIAPGKWARVFDKEGRGTNIAIGKLIARVQKIDNVEDLMAFVMQNKQRFVDENGIDLPVLDKLRAAVDTRNGNVGNKGTSKIENTTLKYDDNGKIKEVESTLIEPSKTARNFKYNKDKLSIDELKDAKNEIDSYIQKLNKEISSLEKIKKENADKLTDNAKANIDGNIAYSKNIINAYTKDKEDCEKLLEEKKDKPVEKKEDDSKTYWIQDNRGNRLTNEDAKKKIIGQMKYLAELEDMAGKKLNNRTANDIRYYIDYLKDRLNPEDRKEIESEAEKYNDKDEENKPEKTIEETKETSKEEKTEKINNVDNSAKVVSFDELQPIASNKSVGENEVQMPYSKDLADEIESLKNCAAPEWENREFMKHVYYDDGNLVTTDGRRLKIVKVGKLDGIQDGTYVDITTDKSGINIKKREGMEDYKFPTYKKVMPDNLSQNVTLDSKLVKEKIKAMQKDGAIDKKGANIVQLEFRDGKVFIDDTAVGDAKDIQLKTSEGWNDPKEDTNYVHFNADYLTNALSGKTAVLQMGEDNHKAMAINTGSTSNVLMPMHGLNAKMDYSSNRSVKAAENEAKDKKKADNRKHSEQLIKDLNEEKIKESIENVAKDIDRQCETSDDDFLRSAYEKLNFNFDKILDKKRYITVHDKVNKDGLTFISAYMHSRLAKEHPEVKEKIAAELEKRGINVKKSLFDDFIVDVFAADNEDEIEDELYEGETEYNDYSAEQPELFNSTSMKVREAMDRIRNQVL